MGKSLKGKELGTGISQRKDGLYTARYTNRQGERKQKYFKKLQECRQWLADQQYKDEYDCAEAGEDMTANAWYEYWMEEVKSPNVKWGTLESYDEMYRTHMQGILGEMKMSKILPIHCQNVLNAMSNSKKRKYKKSTIKKVRTFMKAFFSDAVEYQIIKSNPVTKRVYCKKGAESTERKPLTREEQILFLQAMKGYLYYNPFALILQTGLRYSDDDDKIRLNQRKPSKYKGLRRFGPEKNLQRINKFMKERPIFYKNLIQMKENIRFYLRCFYCITKVMILQFNSENRTELARNG